MIDLIRLRGGITRSEVIAEALEWEGTPYQHKQRVKGEAADCIMFLVGVAECLQICPEHIIHNIEASQYSTEWHLHNNHELLIEHIEHIGLIEKPSGLRSPGDIVGFRFGNATAHLGILIDPNTMMHAALFRPSQVTQARLSAPWEHRLTRCYQIPEITST